MSVRSRPDGSPLEPPNGSAVDLRSRGLEERPEAEMDLVLGSISTDFS